MCEELTKQYNVVLFDETKNENFQHDVTKYKDVYYTHLFEIINSTYQIDFLILTRFANATMYMDLTKAKHIYLFVFECAGNKM